jgi:hypothetical protein
MLRTIHPGDRAQRGVNRRTRACLRAVRGGNTRRRYELSQLRERRQLGKQAAARGWSVSPELVDRFEVEVAWFHEYPDEGALENIGLDWAELNLRDAMRGYI